jgi:hypothetical protein
MHVKDSLAGGKGREKHCALCELHYTQKVCKQVKKEDLATVKTYVN